MPGDTIWLNDAKTEYVLRSDSEANPGIVQHGYTLSYKTEFQEKSDFYSSLALPCSILLLAIIWIIIRIRDGRSRGWVEIGSRGRIPEDDEEEQTYSDTPREIISEPCLSYEGNELNFSDAELNSILNKRSSYFSRLNPFEKEKFIKRLKTFIAGKVFKIHDNSGFKEMPVLISAAAIQLSFGLQYYQLPNFTFIHIYPDAIVRVDQTIKFLEGNVSGDCINISWKYFLEGFELPDDGQNVGLHEMAHAYYFQNLQCRKCEDETFKDCYSTFEQRGNKVFEEEKVPGKDLYSEYAMSDFQEFWAETVEIFFEKPLKLKSAYPELYGTIHDLLNQDPARHQS